MRKEYDLGKAKRDPVVKSKGKTRITIYLDDDVIEAFRKLGDERGRGYQMLINEALRETLGTSKRPVEVGFVFVERGQPEAQRPWQPIEQDAPGSRATFQPVGFLITMASESAENCDLKGQV